MNHGNDGPPAWPRLVAFMPALAFLLTFGVFFVDKNRQARMVLGSPRGILAVAAIVAGYAAISWVLRRTSSRAWIPSVVLAGAVLVLAAWIVRPYYMDSTANRLLVAGPVAPAVPVPGPDVPVTVTDVPVTGPDVVLTAPAAPTTSSPASTAPPPAPEPPTASLVAAGNLAGLGHEARGTVSLIRSAGGDLVVRFEDFDIEGVPDARLHLIPGEDVERAGGLSLGALPGNRGDLLDVAVPQDGDGRPGAGWTLLVWCRAFSVPVANATLG